MSKEEKELWRELKVGDRVRIVHVPNDYFRDGIYLLHRDTLAVYRKLVARKWPLVVSKIDDDGFPWVRFRIFRYGRWEHHSLMINHDGIVRVKSRRKS